MPHDTPLVTLQDGPAAGVRVLTLDDPDRRNAMSPALQADLAAAADTVVADAEARVLVIAGTGSAFSAGADLPAVLHDLDRDVADIRAGLQGIYDSFLRIKRLAIPTIAAVHGAAVGAGVNLALSCDVRLAGPRAKFGLTFTALGIHPGGGCTWFLTQALGRQRALQLILDGAVIDAGEALRLGLVLDVVDDPLSAALETAARWAALDPRLTRDIKRAVGGAEQGSFDDTLQFEGWAQAASAAYSPRLRAAIERFTR